MRKKLLWAFGIGIAVIVVVVIGLSLAVKGYLKSDRLTAMILPKVEESTGRKARIERIDVSLFRGITVKGISLMERDGEKEFLKVKEFILEYSLLPLLEKKLVIRKVGLIAPSVSIIKEKDGRFNFSDILDRSSAGKKEAAPGTEQKGLPLSVEIDSISVRDGRMTFTEEKGDLPAIEVVSDVELKLSAAKGTAGPEVSGKIKIKDLTVKGEGDEIKGSGTVSIGADAVGFDITATVGKNAVKFSGDVRDYRKSPVARADINASELDIEKIMALSSGKEDARKSHPVRRAGPAQKERTKVKGDKEVALTASGEMKIGAAKYKGYI
ncbi:MAG TPA: AsmA family protein, partial [Thermodesulfovibrionales bacterium]|nr:AsmA family protein [Thermodesulfovibrionales bacterium]